MRFEEELELFLADKDLFLEDLYRRLKHITYLWRSWRCQRLRDVSVTQLVSAKQVTGTGRLSFFNVQGYLELIEQLRSRNKIEIFFKIYRKIFGLRGTDSQIFDLQN